MEGKCEENECVLCDANNISNIFASIYVMCMCRYTIELMNHTKGPIIFWAMCGGNGYTVVLTCVDFTTAFWTLN